MAEEHQQWYSNGMYVGPEKGRFSVHYVSQIWLKGIRSDVAMGCMLALNRAGSAFTMLVKDG